MKLYEGDCLEILPQIEDASIDAIISDPPYPEIDREYGRMTEIDWMEMMKEVVRQSRRVLKEKGSAVFILQPNSRKVGSMRLWLWEFLVWAGKEWNIIQDAYWWNFATPPTMHVNRQIGLMRPSVKYSIWLGESDCYRDQNSILLSPAEASMSDKRINRHDLEYVPSGLSRRHGRVLQTMRDRGGSTPFNLVICANSNSSSAASSHGHGAGTPLKLADWWTRYICPSGGTVLDMFAGTGTMGLAAIQNQCNFIGIEKMPKYYQIMQECLSQQGLFA